MSSQRTLQGLHICTTGLSDVERERVIELISQLGGHYSPHYTTKVGVLIANVVGSEKCKVASGLKTPIVRTTWLEAIRANSDLDPTAAMKQHALRALEGLVICATGFSAHEREEIRLLAQRLGAGFSLDLTKDCTHLIAKSNTGSKYEYATKWGLPVASMQWIEDCAAKSALLDPTQYSLTRASLDGLTESASTYRSNTCTSSFMDSCVVHVPDDFDPDILRVVRSLVRETGGTLVNEMDGFVTHCIAQNVKLSQTDIRRYSICRPKIPIISYEWLKKCYDESKLVSMEEYRCGETGIGLLQMQRLNSNMSASVPHSELMRNPSESRLTSLHSTKRIKVVKQHDTNSLIDADLRLMRSPMPHFSSISCPPKDRVSEIQNKIVTHSQIPEMNSDAFLAGKCLTAAGFLPRQIEVIKLEVSKYKGTFTDRSDCDGHCPVYCIVPFDSKIQAGSNETLVTELWLESCRENKKWHDPKEQLYFEPLVGKIEGFANYTFGITNYDGLERKHILQIVKFLGARISSDLSKKNTHLLCPGTSQDSAKCAKAREWGVPIVDKEWIFSRIREAKLEVGAPALYPSEGTCMRATPRKEATLSFGTDAPSVTPSFGSNSPAVPSSQSIVQPLNNTSKAKIPRFQGVIIASEDVSSPHITALKDVAPEPVSARSDDISQPDLEEWLSVAFKKRNLDKAKPVVSLRNSKDSFPNQSRTIPTPQLISENGSFQSISVTYEDSEGIAEKRKLLSQLETRKRIKDDSWEPEPVAALQWSSLANQATPVDDKESKVGKTTKKVFLATGVNINQRSYLAKTIQKLGGTFLQSDTWRPECTHLIVGRLSRTEKCLAACAAGAWFLDAAYVKESEKAKIFLPEEDFECAQRATKMSKLTNEERVTIAAAKRWRESLSKEGRGGSFDKWKVLLVVEKSRAEGFTRVLHAGQAQVHVYTGRPMDLQNVTHCLVESEQLAKYPEIKGMVANGTVLFDSTFIADYLFSESVKPGNVSLRK